MSNNIFEFATKELSQDAFISWLINGINGDNPRLKETAADFIEKILYAGKFPGTVETVKVVTQWHQIDVLAIINGNHVLIIEDKTLSSEHDNQIEKYVTTVKEKSAELTKLGLGNKFDIHVAYFKTGYWNDFDHQLLANHDYTPVTSQTIMAFLIPLQDADPLIRDYVAYIKEHFVEAGEKARTQFKTSLAGVSSAASQYYFFDYLFPIKDHPNRLIKQGNSGKNAWTHYAIWQDTSTEPNKAVFWRIDVGAQGPIISLALYQNHRAESRTNPEQGQKMAAAEATAYAALKIKLLESENGELASAVNLMGPRVAPQSSSPKSNEPKLLRLKFTKKNQPTAQQIKAAIQVITPFVQDAIKWP